MDTAQGSTFNQFTTNQYVNSTQDFLNSNSIVAQIAFLLLVLFVFMILLRLGISLLGYLFAYSNETPRLIDGMVDAKQLIIIPQDPESEGAITINRSSNANEGIEFTWSVWIFIDDLTYNSGRYRCVFYKGNDYAKNPDAEVQGLNFPNNAPGLYLGPNTNSLIVMMNTFNVINEEIEVCPPAKIVATCPGVNKVSDGTPVNSIAVYPKFTIDVFGNIELNSNAVYPVFFKFIVVYPADNMSIVE